MLSRVYMLDLALEGRMLARWPAKDGQRGWYRVQQSDEELIGRLADGDMEALELIYARYARPVFSLAVRVLRDEAEAEEVTQDVFERVWRHASSFDRGRGRFATWLLSMTHHVAIDALRKRQRRPQATGGEVGAIMLQLAPDPHMDVAAATYE